MASQALKKSSLRDAEQKKYFFVLPNWVDGLWDGIQGDGPESLKHYLCENKIIPHSGVHNLLSSWVLCANLYFPFRHDLDLMGRFLKQTVFPEIAALTGIELEYVADSPYDTKTLLGEPRGNRGNYQTSPDIAFIFTTTDGGPGVILTENKFVEYSFYPCSGRQKKYKNPYPQRCLDINAVLANPLGQCHLLNWREGKRENRRYWNYTKVDEHGRESLKHCPAAFAGYQLFRQQALAEAFIESGKFPKVISCVAFDGRNETLIGCLKNTGINRFQEWGTFFGGKSRFSFFTHQQWVQWVGDNDQNNRWKSWLDYIINRYGLL